MSTAGEEVDGAASALAGDEADAGHHSRQRQSMRKRRGVHQPCRWQSMQSGWGCVNHIDSG